MAPTYAVPSRFARENLALQDFDFYEIHEAFAAQVLCTLAAWEDEELLLDDARTGRAARLDRPHAHERERRIARDRASVRRDGRTHRRHAGEDADESTHSDGKPLRGLISICAAAGQGVVAILER